MENGKHSIEIVAELDGVSEVRKLIDWASSFLGMAVELLEQLDGRVITARCRPSLPELSDRSADTSSPASAG